LLLAVTTFSIFWIVVGSSISTPVGTSHGSESFTIRLRQLIYPLAVEGLTKLVSVAGSIASK
jgi:hypothetical protein